jgi:hypothetical protein
MNEEVIETDDDVDTSGIRCRVSVDNFSVGDNIAARRMLRTSPIVQKGGGRR